MKSLSEIKSALNQPLDGSYVEQRSDGRGGQLDYIPAWYAIAKANDVFGADGWDRETVNWEVVTEEENRKGTMFAEVVATVKVCVRASDTSRWITREGSGQGRGFSDERVGDALKTAESDAMKRALMTFGNPFGLPLYTGNGDLSIDLPHFTGEQKQELRRYVADMDVDKSELASVFQQAEDEGLSVEETKALFDDLVE